MNEWIASWFLHMLDSFFSDFVSELAYRFSMHDFWTQFPFAYTGSKEEAFFDSKPWLDSDGEDDFYSVNGGKNL